MMRRKKNFLYIGFAGSEYELQWLFFLGRDQNGSPRQNRIGSYWRPYAPIRYPMKLADHHACMWNSKKQGTLKALQKPWYKKTTDSNHGVLVAHDFLDQDFTCALLIRNGVSISALNRAIVAHRSPPSLTNRSDRGSQFCSYDYQKAIG